MSANYYPLHIWLQPIDDYGVDVGEPGQTFHLELIHIQTGEHIVNPRYVSEDIDAHFAGEWTVQEREWREHKIDGALHIPRNLTIFIRQRN